MLIITDKQLIGRREKVDFPELGLHSVNAKIDTGAYTAVLHCHDISTFRKRGKLYAAFYLLDPGHPQYNDKKLTLPVLARRQIKSSTGHKERRVIVKTKLKVGSQRYTLEISLTDRSKMEFPVLLGRKFLSKNFIVDVSQYNLTQKSKSKSIK